VRANGKKHWHFSGTGIIEDRFKEKRGNGKPKMKILWYAFFKGLKGVPYPAMRPWNGCGVVSRKRKCRGGEIRG